MTATITHRDPPADYRARITGLMTALAPEGLFEEEFDLLGEISANPGRYVPSPEELERWEPCLQS